jgi:hypothetical protein
MTKHGFYSIVQKKPGEFHIRSRVRKDLENLGARVPLTGTKIHDTNGADYAHRLVVGKDEVLSVMEFLGETLDYSNFKNKIAATDDQEQKHHLYSQIWGILSRAFGCYGDPGTLSTPPERSGARTVRSRTP